ncbi:MAG: prolipoprotein diacylglyceryl transferase [Christensenellales bacterium]|jgi:phosphatidylglycerol:prolipoprotein diacylglycerol transferase
MFEPVDSGVAFVLFGKEIYWYAILICFGIALAVALMLWWIKKQGYDNDIVIDIALWVIPAAIVGARLYYVIFEWSQFSDNLLSILYIWEGGLGFYGGVIGGVLAGYIFCKIRKTKFGVLADAVAPGIAIAQAIGRWGNYFNQEAFGYAVTDPNIISFPFACVRIDRIHYVDGVLCDAPYHYATFFYESVWNLLVFIALMIYFRKKRPRGNVFALYLVLYGLGRAVIEGFRADSLWVIPGVVRASQALSILLMAGGIAYLIWNNKKGRLGMGDTDDSGLTPLKKQPQQDGADAQD